MKITVLGAGAMGALFGGLLAEAGHAVTLLDVNDAHIEQVRTHGLRLITDAADRRVRVPILRPEQATEVPDWLLVFTKTLHTERALAAVVGLIGPHTRVLSLQNGLGNAERLAVQVPWERIAVGVTTVPADLQAPGQVHSGGQGHVRMMWAEGHDDPALARLAEALTDVGLHGTVDPGVKAAIWEKVAFNAALNSLCAVTGCTVGEIGAHAASRTLAHAIASEVLAVARQSGVQARDAVHGVLDHAMDHHLHHKPSMLQDVLAGRPTEIEAINGEVVRQAASLGCAVPLTDTLATLVRLREQAGSRR
ncbi:ketopantoate reductase family protein [Ideonella livida]|uniref:2-dehydropantoate 2-reductase n=1 Tax=Ideonella livida TaxID=2707176 RepID=A0A7C9PKM2_9BURK|nr:2-dehydropantoate 2-reductase [Ideonella livida]NDY93474.1 2-dehydropantoate 2-reductase [Ideonella livida]